MKCSRCQHENPSGAKFCEECATPLARTCANCGTQLSATAKFCPECAHPVAAGVVTQRRFTSPETYTPKHLAEKMILTSMSRPRRRAQASHGADSCMKGSMELLADRRSGESAKDSRSSSRTLMEAVTSLRRHSEPSDGAMELWRCFRVHRWPTKITRCGVLCSA